MAQSAQPQNNNSAFNSKHPRGAGGKFGSKGGGSTQPKVSPQTATQLRDYQQRNNLPVTGTFDARTLASLRQQGATAADLIGSDDTTTVKEAAAHSGKGKSHGKTKAAAAKKEAAATTRAAKAKLTAARRQASSQAQAINGLTRTQRAAYRKQNPKPPAGYTYANTGRLVSATRAAAVAQLAATIKP